LVAYSRKNEYNPCVIITKYGFIEDVGECMFYEDGLLENVSFTSDIKKADLFSSKDDLAPKYARGVDSRATAEDWAKIIGGELITLTVTKTTTSIEEVSNGIKTFEETESVKHSYLTHAYEEQGFLEYEYKEN
jgi:hypothetical protein